MTHAKLQTLTVKELRVLAVERGVVNAARMLKSELISALERQSDAAPDQSNRTRVRRKASFTAPNSAPPAVPKNQAPSSLPPQIPVPQAPPAGTNLGLPIPDTYGADRLVLMVQDPHHIFVYWEITPHALSQLRLSMGGGTPVLVVHSVHGDESREVDLNGGNYYLVVAPDTSYHAELALRDGLGRLHILARSNRVATPAPSVSTRVEEQWMGVEDTFHELLEMAGLPDHLQTGSSRQMAKMSDQRMVAWGWKESGVRPFSSGTLSSHSLSSGALVRTKPSSS